MKLKLYVTLDVYNKFQIDISKYVKQSPENLETSKTCKNNRQNSKNTIFAKYGTNIEEYTAGHLYNKFEGLILLVETRQIWGIW